MQRRLVLRIRRMIGRGVEVHAPFAGAGRNARQQLVVQVCVSIRYHVHDEQSDTLVEIAGAFSDEGIAMLGTVLVRWANEFDGARKCWSPRLAKHLDFN